MRNTAGSNLDVVLGHNRPLARAVAAGGQRVSARIHVGQPGGMRGHGVLHLETRTGVGQRDSAPGRAERD